MEKEEVMNFFREYENLKKERQIINNKYTEVLTLCFNGPIKENSTEPVDCFN